MRNELEDNCVIMAMAFSPLQSPRANTVYYILTIHVTKFIDIMRTEYGFASFD